MNKNIMYIELYDIYGKLLTKKQQYTFNLYYMCDLSLREIAENENISFQAVRDCIKKAEKQLDEFESVIGMLKQKEYTTKLKDTLKELDFNNSKLDKILNKM